MDNLFRLLEKISQKPGLYIGSPSATPLRHFLVGYKFARQEMGILPTEIELDFCQEFQPWLQRHFNLQTTNAWDKILLFKYVDDVVAFEQFFHLLSVFRQRDKSQDVDPVLIEDPQEVPEQVAY